MRFISRRVVLRATAGAAALFTTTTGVPPTLAAPVSGDLPQYVTLSRTGDRMPLVGLGTWESAPGEVGGAVAAALDAGCTHIDCAAAYRNEKEIGGALKASGIPRKSLFLTSKLWNDRRRPQDVRDALDTTLSRLGTDYLDLYLVHWPVVWAKNSVMKPDGGASLRECWQTLEALVDEGKVRNIGVSNMKQSELEELFSYARIRPSVNQIELHPRLPQSALVEYCQQRQVALTAYSPLGRGDVKKAGLLASPTVTAIAQAHKVSTASVLLRWNLERNVVVIPKSVNPTRIASNVREPWSFALTAEERTALAALEDGARFCTAPWSTFDDKTTSARALEGVITLLARGVFSVASLDITHF